MNREKQTWVELRVLGLTEGKTADKEAIIKYFEEIGKQEHKEYNYDNYDLEHNMSAVLVL